MAIKKTSQLERRKILRQFLGRYYRAKQRKINLLFRLSELRRERDGLGGKPPSADNIHGKGQTSDRTAATAHRILDIEDRIDKQIKEQTDAVTEIMDMIDHLRPGSTEREIIELRHIDCLEWPEIEKRIHLTKSPCFEHYNKGLDQLLELRWVRERIGLEK